MNTATENQGGVRLREFSTFSRRAGRMADDTSGKKKIPHDPNALLAIEDHLERIKKIFRDIRQEMSAAGMPSVELATGTTVHYLTLVEGFAEKYQGDFRKQRGTFLAKRAKAPIIEAAQKDERKRTQK